MMGVWLEYMYVCGVYGVCGCLCGVYICVVCVWCVWCICVGGCLCGMCVVCMSVVCVWYVGGCLCGMCVVCVWWVCGGEGGGVCMVYVYGVCVRDVCTVAVGVGVGVDLALASLEAPVSPGYPFTCSSLWPGSKPSSNRTVCISLCHLSVSAVCDAFQMSHTAHD